MLYVAIMEECIGNSGTGTIWCHQCVQSMSVKCTLPIVCLLCTISNIQIKIVIYVSFYIPVGLISPLVSGFTPLTTFIGSPTFVSCWNMKKIWSFLKSQCEKPLIFQIELLISFAFLKLFWTLKYSNMNKK